MNNEDNGINWFIKIPSFILYDKKLNSSQKILLGLINSLSDGSGNSFALNRYFSEILGVNKSRISSLISDLKKKGYISIQIKRKENKQIQERIIKLNDPFPIIKNRNTPIFKNDKPPIIKNDKENNKLFNKIKIEL